jgi:hypothetical protein
MTAHQRALNWIMGLGHGLGIELRMFDALRQ